MATGDKMKILPDGTIQIENRRTGETKVVRPEELPQYNLKLPENYNSLLEQTKQQTLVVPQSQPTTQVKDYSSNIEKAKQNNAVLNQPASLGDVSTITQSGDYATKYQDIQKRYSQAMVGKTPSEISQLQNSMQAELETITPVPKTKEQEKQSELLIKKNQVSQTAQAVMDVIQAGKEGSLSGKAYKDALNSTASDLYIKMKEAANMGAALSPGEIAILAGQAPVIKKYGPSGPSKIKQWFTGEEPVQKGEVADNEETLMNKMKLIQAGMSGEGISPDLLTNLSSAQGQTEQKKGIQLSDIPGNAAQDVKEIFNGLLNTPNVLVENFNEVQAKTGRIPTQFEVAFNLAKKLGVSTIQEYNELLGRPLEGGDIAGRAIERATKKPVTTVLDIIPFTKLGKMGKGSAATKGNALTSAGEAIQKDIRQIKVKPSVYGASKEAAINETLTKRGITGTPSQQYARLEPEMTKIGREIQDILDKSPKKVSTKQIVNDLNINLEEDILSGNLESKAAVKQSRSLIQDLYKSVKGTPAPTELSTSDVFKLKQKVNQLYKGVAKKIENNSPLTDREKVISVARQTLDDTISSAHPEVKELTTMQSHLYDAAKPLYTSRNTVPTVRGPGGFTIPTSPIATTKSLISGGLMKSGKTIQSIPNIEDRLIMASLASRTDKQKSK